MLWIVQKTLFSSHLLSFAMGRLRKTGKGESQKAMDPTKGKRTQSSQGPKS